MTTHSQTSRLRDHFCVTARIQYFSMTNFVLVVPKQTLNVLLVSWLSLNDVGRLDSALCDRACREIFEHSLTLRSFVGTTDALWAKPKFIRWVIKRKVKVETLFVQSNLIRTKNMKVRYQLFKAMGPSLRSAVISCDKDVKFNIAYFTQNNNYYVESGSESHFDSDAEIDLDCITSVSDVVSEQKVETELIDEVVEDLSLQCTKLETFTVLGQHSGSVISLLQMNPNLRNLTIRNCPKALRCIGNLCPKATCVSIKECACRIDLEVFASNIPVQLQRLCLPGTHVEKDFLKPVLACLSLLELRVGSVSFDWTALASTCPNLDVFRCTVLPHQNILSLVAQLAAVMPSLRTLILVSGDVCCYMSTYVLGKLLESFPMLRQFCSDAEYEDKLFALPHEPAGRPAASAPRLEELYVGRPTKIGKMFHWEGALRVCPALRSVGISFACDRMGAHPFRLCVGAGVRRIVSRAMDYAYNYDYAELIGLHELDLSLCTLLTDSALRDIAINCPQLTLLHVHDAPDVTVQGVMDVLKRCRKLRSLECVYKSKGEEKSKRARKREKGAVAAVVALCKRQYPQIQHIRLRFV